MPLTHNNTRRARKSSGNVVEDFERACDLAEAEAKKQPVPEEILRVRRLLADGITLDRAWVEIQRARESVRLSDKQRAR
jgi:hypothetical protein